MCNEPEASPWLCHVCDIKSTGESVACSVCYRTTCHLHLQHVSVLNEENGLYEIQPVCVLCTVEKALQ